VDISYWNFLVFLWGNFGVVVVGCVFFFVSFVHQSSFCYLSGQKPLSIFGFFDKPWKRILEEETLPEEEEIDESGFELDPVERQSQGHLDPEEPLNPDPNPDDANVDWPLDRNDLIMIKLLRKRLVDLGPLEGGR